MPLVPFTQSHYGVLVLIVQLYLCFAAVFAAAAVIVALCRPADGGLGLPYPPPPSPPLVAQAPHSFGASASTASAAEHKAGAEVTRGAETTGASSVMPPPLALTSPAAAPALKRVYSSDHCRLECYSEGDRSNNAKTE